MYLDANNHCYSLWNARHFADLYQTDKEPHWLKSIKVGAGGGNDNIRAGVSGIDGVKIDWFCPSVVNLSLSPSK